MIEKSENNLAIISTKAQDLIAASQRAVIDSNETMEKGADLAKMLKSLAKKIEEIRVTKVKPLNDEVKIINEQHKSIIDPLTMAAKTVEGKMLTFQREQERIAREEAEARKLQQEQERLAAIEAAKTIDENGDSPEIIVPEVQEVTAIAVPQLTRSLRGSVAGIRKTWTYEVTDIVALANARPDLVQEISARINAEIKGEDGNRNIPGLKIYQQETMSVR